MRGNKKTAKKSNKFLYWSLALVVVAVLLLVIPMLLPKNNPVNPISPEALAKCLTEKGIKMYGSIYCPHCTAQKELFGEAFKLVNYVECTDANNSALCSGLRGVPAWDINGQIYYGSQELSKLKELSGC